MIHKSILMFYIFPNGVAFMIDKDRALELLTKDLRTVKEIFSDDDVRKQELLVMLKTCKKHLTGKWVG